MHTQLIINMNLQEGMVNYSIYTFILQTPRHLHKVV
jgi:hypothetical protein